MAAHAKTNWLMVHANASLRIISEKRSQALEVMVIGSGFVFEVYNASTILLKLDQDQPSYTALRAVEEYDKHCLVSRAINGTGTL